MMLPIPVSTVSSVPSRLRSSSLMVQGRDRGV
jgi:hypothetical protein